MNYPYLISSDQHCHEWTQFSRTEATGVNSRLQVILDELRRSYDTLVARGGSRAFLAGDLFHVRGKIEPSIFNPTFSTFEAIHDIHLDVDTVAIPGNHDLQGRDADELGNAMQQLRLIDRFAVDTKIALHQDVIVIPWYADLNELRAHMRSQAAAMRANGCLEQMDLIIHAPVNGVIKGIPGHGLEAAELADLGFRRVFAGHYHDHKVMESGKVISIGATTHQTWGDVGTKAGFLLVYKDRIEHHESLTPKFVDLGVEDELDADDMHLRIEGNYVKLRLDDVTEAEIKQWRKELTDAGALGVNITATKKVTTGRSGAGAKATLTLAASVSHYIENDIKPLLAEEVSKMAMEVLAEAES